MKVRRQKQTASEPRATPSGAKASRRKAGADRAGKKAGPSGAEAASAAPNSPFDDLIKRARELAQRDDAGARNLAAAALAADLGAERRDMLMRAAAKATGFAFQVMKAVFVRAWREHEERKRETPDAQEAERLAKETEAKAREIVRDAERERLWQSCREIAESKTLLADMENVARQLGVVGEGSAIRGVYLTASSRFCRHEAMRLLRRGAPAGGKNYLVEKPLTLIPDEDIVRVSSGSPLSLVYFGGDDENALQHKVLYVPEAAILAERNGVENPLPEF